MKRRILCILGISLLVFGLQSCSSHPEKGLLTRYFNALSLNDLTTLSTMAIDPVILKFDSWEIVSVSEEIVEAAQLGELNTKELELKKSVEESVGITLDARDQLDDAIFERDNARTRAARRAAQQKVDEMQTQYDEQYKKHQELQKDYNLAKEQAAKEEEIASFSLGSDFPNIRDFTGNVSFKEVEVKIDSEGTASQYNILLRRYVLRDESLDMTHRGRWIIVKFEKI